MSSDRWSRKSWFWWELGSLERVSLVPRCFTITAGCEFGGFRRWSPISRVFITISRLFVQIGVLFTIFAGLFISAFRTPNNSQRFTEILPKAQFPSCFYSGYFFLPVKSLPGHLCSEQPTHSLQSSLNFELRNHQDCASLPPFATLAPWQVCSIPSSLIFSSSHY